jgi:hypothetical protein
MRATISDFNFPSCPQEIGASIRVNKTHHAILLFKSGVTLLTGLMEIGTALGNEISWTGTGTLEQSDTVIGPWSAAPSQNNPQNVPTTSGAKFYRLRQ